MEEMEDTTEKLREIQEELNENERKESWMLMVALTTAIISVLAAITGLFAGHHANEGITDQIKSSDQWAYYQSKSIKLNIEKSTATILRSLDKPVDSNLEKTQAKYEKEKDDIKEIATEKQHESEHHFRIHNVLATAVTFFQVAIAVSAIAIVVRKKPLWYLSLALTVVGLYFMITGFFTL